MQIKVKRNTFLWHSTAYIRTCMCCWAKAFSTPRLPLFMRYACASLLFCTNVLTSFTPDIFIVATDFQVWLNYTIRIKCFLRARTLGEKTFEFNEEKKIVTDTWFSLQFYSILFYFFRSFISTSARPWTNEWVSEWVGAFVSTIPFVNFPIFRSMRGEDEEEGSGCERS